ncbi:GEVED domain-containing protein [Spirosoma endophyticum]|uniref:Por secretion system C-terminal sorting domain-containing protein n=1 Tax=Spirosoma endophyticum TaxID=662367 RepID=A0A1I1MG43_9BACT|nr:GEVED domain-containing protein [Spirosoma endophyticum]SFC82058.1 Por secretion system C-terminal sorting domain-containing protein [Spirosoma endophyticum]
MKNHTFLPSFSLTSLRYVPLIVALGLLTLCASEVQGQSFDFGDAPDSYKTLISSDGPRHKPYTSVYLGGSYGSTYDAESDGQPSSMADGDDTHDQNGNQVYNRSDEDGLVNGFGAVCVSKTSYKLQITVYNNSGADATVSAWIDLNKNGTFDDNERTQAVVPTTPSLTHYNGTLVTLVWNGLSGITEGWSYARLRVANNPAEVDKPTGLANSGEVEDYRVHLKDEYDFGDAPDSYGTLLKSNGARHMINNNVILLGPLDCSAEDDGQTSTLADADAGETSVGFPYKLTTAKTSFSALVNVLNTSGGNALLSGWIDFNRNGVFDANERAQAAIGVDTRNLVLNWTGLSGLTEGRTYARFRVATNADEVANPTGTANNGSVEDYTLMIEAPQYDYGDAPNSYGTSLSSNGPRHIYNDVVTNLALSDGVISNNIDTESDGQPSNQANGDDALATNSWLPVPFDDETGLVESPPLTTTSTSYSVTLSVKNQTGVDATLSGWIDFNQNGTFEANERAQATVPSSQDGGLTQVKLYWNALTNLTGGQTFMRFRIASNAAEVADPTGVASDGEVEDYSLIIVSVKRSPMPVNLVSFQGQWVENKGNQLSWVTSWEQNNDHFDIQRSSDAKSFESIGRMAGKGTTSATQSYAYIDDQSSPNEVVYYRLKQVDLDGTVTYSRIISIRQGLEAGLSLVIYPNPASEQVNLRLPTSHKVAGVRVFSVSGAQMMSQEGEVETLDIKPLPTGIYVIEVRTLSGNVLRQRFVKQ